MIHALFKMKNVNIKIRSIGRSDCFCNSDLGLHAKFHYPRTTPSLQGLVAAQPSLVLSKMENNLTEET